MSEEASAGFCGKKSQCMLKFCCGNCKFLTVCCICSAGWDTHRSPVSFGRKLPRLTEREIQHTAVVPHSSHLGNTMKTLNINTTC